MESDAQEQLKALLAGYPVTLAIPVLWGDQDAFRHVNNTVYFRWYESARIVYNRRIGLMDPDRDDAVGPILAATSNNYRRQIAYPDAVQIGVRVARIGRTSINFEHVVVSEAQQAIAADGASTLVVFDYQANRPRPVPDSIRRAIEALEGRTFADADAGDVGRPG